MIYLIFLKYFKNLMDSWFYNFTKNSEKSRFLQIECEFFQTCCAINYLMYGIIISPSWYQASNKDKEFFRDDKFFPKSPKLSKLNFIYKILQFSFNNKLISIFEYVNTNLITKVSICTCFYQNIFLSFTYYRSRNFWLLK